jgi:hypothetical protein
MITESKLLYIVEGFNNKSLPKEEWTHEAHLITGIWHLKNFAKYDALCRLRSGIIAYNLSVGGKNTGSNGYHETITAFWVEVISQFVEQHKNLNYEQLCNTFLNSGLSKRHYPYVFYTKEFLMSTQARAYYHAPNVQPVNIKI